METITLDHDIHVFYVTAAAFPGGIADAQQQIHELVPFAKDRKFFGISRPENGTIIYRAAAEELEQGEGARLSCGTLVLEKGKYISMVIQDYMNDLQSIGSTFRELLSHPGLDPNGYCVEWYLSDKEVRCMIRLEQ